jgi:hypothetical protein
MFGKEGEGVHSFRIFDVAVVDLVLTIIGSAALAYYIKCNYFLTFAVVFVVGVIMHRIFCVNTTVNKAIFGTIP